MTYEKGTPYYDSLLKQKASGTLLLWEQVTPEIIERLFCEEICSDSLIASLFEVEKKKVTAYRRKWNITDSSYRTKKMTRLYEDEVAASLIDSPISYETIIDSNSAVKYVVELFEALSEEDKQVFRDYIIRHDEKLKEKEKELIKYRSFYRAFQTNQLD